MVENVNRIGEALGVVWSFFQNEAGELTVGACLLLAAIAFVSMGSGATKQSASESVMPPLAAPTEAATLSVFDHAHLVGRGSPPFQCSSVKLAEF